MKNKKGVGHSLRHKENTMCVVSHTHNIFHACDSHSYLAGLFQVANSNREMTKLRWQLQLQHYFAFLLEHGVSKVLVSHTNLFS